MGRRMKYKYDWGYGLPDHLVVRGVASSNYEANMIGCEMNIISKFIWGLGAAMNSVYNAHGFSVKFQSSREHNILRARLLTKIWRYCKKNEITIRGNRKIFDRMKRNNERLFTENYNQLIEIINIRNYEKLQPRTP